MDLRELRRRANKKLLGFFYYWGSFLWIFLNFTFCSTIIQYFYCCIIFLLQWRCWIIIFIFISTIFLYVFKLLYQVKLILFSKFFCKWFFNFVRIHCTTLNPIFKTFSNTIILNYLTKLLGKFYWFLFYSINCSFTLYKVSASIGSNFLSCIPFLIPFIVFLKN